VGVAVGIGSDRFDNWAPNLATEALSIAVTIAIVERIVKREASERVRARVEYAMGLIGWDFGLFATSVGIDYAATHLDTFEPLPQDALALFDRFGWRRGLRRTTSVGHSTENGCRRSCSRHGTSRTASNRTESGIAKCWSTKSSTRSTCSRRT
jgi:hypothetical protein